MKLLLDLLALEVVQLYLHPRQSNNKYLKITIILSTHDKLNMFSSKYTSHKRQF